MKLTFKTKIPSLKSQIKKMILKSSPRPRPKLCKERLKNELCLENSKLDGNRYFLERNRFSQTVKCGKAVNVSLIFTLFFNIRHVMHTVALLLQTYYGLISINTAAPGKSAVIDS